MDQLTALKKYYEGIAAIAEATIDIYINNPVGIGEHPQIMDELRKQITILGDAWDGIDTIASLQNRKRVDYFQNQTYTPPPIYDSEK